jgi:diguanylate cyclase (GGDEF)-like protein
MERIPWPERVRSAIADLLAGELADSARQMEERGARPTEVAAILEEVCLGSLAKRGDQIPLDLALHARLTAERLQRQGVGLDALLEVAMGVLTAVQMTAARPPKNLSEIGQALTLLLVRAYLEVDAGTHEEQKRELRSLFTIARAVSRTLDPPEVAEAALKETLGAMSLDSGALWLGRDDEAAHMLMATYGLTDREAKLVANYDLSQAPQVLEALQTGVPVPFEVESDDQVLGVFRSAILVHLSGSSGLEGLLAVGSRRLRTFSTVDLSFLAAVGDCVSMALDHALTHLREAHTDYLTGLANRSEFERSVRRALAMAARHREPLTLMVLDLDDLKRINDTQGHHAGDAAIRNLAEVIRSAVRTSDVSARLGGDEFGIAMPGADFGQAGEVATRLRQALPPHLEVSVGAAQWEPGVDYAELFETADRLLYRDKKRHRARRIRPPKAAS